MKILIISDTHNQHEKLGVLTADVLIHCGDSGLGWDHSDNDVDRLDDWFSRQNMQRILYVGGNHDFAIERRAGEGAPVFRNAVYLQDQAYRFGGVNFYGAPWIPELYRWAFYQPTDELRSRWALIPNDTDVLITHTPPRNILDVSSRGVSCGCPELRERLTQLTPLVHCFGHVHASGGSVDLESIRYINASMVNSRYEVVREPHFVDLEIPQEL